MCCPLFWNNILFQTQGPEIPNPRLSETSQDLVETHVCSPGETSEASLVHTALLFQRVQSQECLTWLWLGWGPPLVSILTGPEWFFTFLPPTPTPPPVGAVCSVSLWIKAKKKVTNVIRVVHDTPCVASWATHKYQRGESETFHAKGPRH